MSEQAVSADTSEKQKRQLQLGRPCRGVDQAPEAAGSGAASSAAMLGSSNMSCANQRAATAAADVGFPARPSSSFTRRPPPSSSSSCCHLANSAVNDVLGRHDTPLCEYQIPSIVWILKWRLHWGVTLA